jgi:hypothetical protein
MKRTSVAIFRALVALYPRDFRALLGESMLQMFRDGYADHERRGRLARFLVTSYAGTLAGLTSEHVRQIWRVSMQRVFASPNGAAALSLALCLPLAMMVSIALLNIDPIGGPISGVTADGATLDRVGSLLFLAGFALLPVALFVNAAPSVRRLASGQRLVIAPVNLVLGAAIFLALAFLVGAVIIDQYPCWLGVPNCD